MHMMDDLIMPEALRLAWNALTKEQQKTYIDKATKTYSIDKRKVKTKHK